MPSPRGFAMQSAPQNGGKLNSVANPSLHLRPDTMLSRAGKNFLDTMVDNLLATAVTDLAAHSSEPIDLESGTLAGLPWEKVTAAAKSLQLGAGTGIATPSASTDVDTIYRIDLGRKVTRYGAIARSSGDARNGPTFNVFNETNLNGLFMRGSNGQLQFVEIVNGVSTVRAFIADARITTTGFVAHLSVIKRTVSQTGDPDPNGNVFDCYLDGVFKFTYTSTNQSATRHVGVLVRTGDVRGMHGY